MTPAAHTSLAGSTLDDSTCAQPDQVRAQRMPAAVKACPRPVPGSCAEHWRASHVRTLCVSSLPACLPACLPASHLRRHVPWRAFQPQVSARQLGWVEKHSKSKVCVQHRAGCRGRMRLYHAFALECQTGAITPKRPDGTSRRPKKLSTHSHKLENTALASRRQHAAYLWPSEVSPLLL